MVMSEVMRQYRGLTKDDKWVYGYYLQIQGRYCIVEENAHIGIVDASVERGWIEVIPDTVGQQVGLKDKKGTEIYEGEIVKVSKIHPKGFKSSAVVSQYKIEWLEADGVYFVSAPPYNIYISLGNVDFLGEIEVIGNIHQDSKLLKQ